MNLLVFRRTRIYEITGFLCAAYLIYLSGWRLTGFDRDNYLTIHDLIGASHFLDKIIVSKDLTFLLISQFVSSLSLDAIWIFLITNLLAILAKYLAVRKISTRLLLSYIFLYGLFLSPGLEFAAIRSSLAIGFLICAIAYRESKLKFLLFSLLSAASHLSIVLVLVILVASPWLERFGRGGIPYILMAIFTYFFGNIFTSIYSSGEIYIGNAGTIFAYALPVATIIFSVIAFVNMKIVNFKKYSRSEFDFLKISKPVIFGVNAVALGFVNDIVTASSRYLEVSWFLLLLVCLINFRINIAAKINLLAFLVFLTVVNVKRNTWEAILNPQFFI